MDKWYTCEALDNTPIISTRVRLARNIKKYPFPTMLDESDAQKMIQEVVASVENDRTCAGALFSQCNIDSANDIEIHSLLERHIISPEFLKTKHKKGLLLHENESSGIMLNEEDHIRIQSIYPGEAIDEAWLLAEQVDNLIEESLEYAFDRDFGYLTSCPTNTGTGLRASYMAHLPMLESTGQLKNIIQAIAKFGMVVRGIYGEGSESSGSIYQISNQITMGQSEQEIMRSLKHVTNQVIDRERILVDKMLAEKPSELEDCAYRAYGLLTHARRLTAKEAMVLLSNVRLGFVSESLKLPRPRLTIYNLMMNIQPGSLQKLYGRALSEQERDLVRAEYIRSNF